MTQRAETLSDQQNLILTLFAICELKQVNPAVVTAPAKYRDDISAMQRRSVIQELAKAGNPTKVIKTICPLARETIQRMLK